MSLSRITLIGFFLIAVSVGLNAYHVFFHPVFDFRLIAAAVSVISYIVLIFEMKKSAGPFQLYGFLLAMMMVGASVDHKLPLIPFMSIALLISSILTRKFFRQWFSETTFLWLDPVFVVLSFAIYVYGNIYYEYGWKGWVFPAIPLVFNAFLATMDFIFATTTIKYISEKKLIHETGKKAPNFCLRDSDGNEVKLSDYNGSRNVLLMFVRNAWCPSCHIMLRTYQRNNQKFKEKDVLLFAIGPNSSEINKQMAIDLGIDFRILTDEGQKTAMAYRVHLPSEIVGVEEGMPLPASFLICKKGIIRYTSRPDKIGEFFAPETIFPILESLN